MVTQALLSNPVTAILKTIIPIAIIIIVVATRKNASRVSVAVDELPKKDVSTLDIARVALAATCHPIILPGSILDAIQTINTTTPTPNPHGIGTGM